MFRFIINILTTTTIIILIKIEQQSLKHYDLIIF